MPRYHTPDVSREQIAQVMDDFYARVQQHPMLSPAFAVVQDWSHHKAVLTHYWWMALGGEPYMEYTYDIGHKHRQAGYTPELLNEYWMPVFEQTVRAHIAPEWAEIWLNQARKIGGMMNLVDDYWRSLQTR